MSQEEERWEDEGGAEPEGPATSDIGASSGSPPVGEVTVSYATQTAPLATRSLACSGSGARCRYVSRIWPLRSILRSTACGSFTLTIMLFPFILEIC